VSSELFRPKNFLHFVRFAAAELILKKVHVIGAFLCVSCRIWRIP
jgi:hypothetical protein